MKVTSCVLSIPTGLTESQRNQLIAKHAGVPPEDVAFIADFIRKQCRSFITAIKGDTIEKLLCPPTSTCCI